MIVRLLSRFWGLPWPPGVRARLKSLAVNPRLNRLLFPTFLVGVVGVIRNDKDEVLLLHHTYRDRYPWGLPSGWLERGEQPREALMRELEEETGFGVKILGVREAMLEERASQVSIVFDGKYVEGGFRASGEVSQARFFPAHELPELLPSQQKIIKKPSATEVTH